jgi:hypothetical protein
MRGGLAGAGTATMPWRHGITRPPTPLPGVEPFLLPPYFITSTCWNVYLYHPKKLSRFYLSLQDVSTTVLRDSCSMCSGTVAAAYGQSIPFEGRSAGGGGSRADEACRRQGGIVGRPGYGQKLPQQMSRLSHGHNAAQALSGCRPAQRTMGLVREVPESTFGKSQTTAGGWELLLNLIGRESGGRMSTATGECTSLYCLAVWPRSMLEVLRPMHRWRRAQPATHTVGPGAAAAAAGGSCRCRARPGARRGVVDDAQ